MCTTLILESLLHYIGFSLFSILDIAFICGCIDSLIFFKAISSKTLPTYLAMIGDESLLWPSLSALAQFIQYQHLLSTSLSHGSRCLGYSWTKNKQNSLLWWDSCPLLPLVWESTWETFHLKPQVLCFQGSGG